MAQSSQLPMGRFSWVAIYRRPRSSLNDLPPLRTWHDGLSTVLVGDAAHGMTPNLGQGAAQALQDVAILLSELASAPVPDALAAYERHRKRSAEHVVVRSRMAGRVAQAAHPVTALLRDGLARITPDRVTLRQAATVLASEPAKSACGHLCGDGQPRRA